MLAVVTDISKHDPLGIQNGLRVSFAGFTRHASSNFSAPARDYRDAQDKEMEYLLQYLFYAKYSFYTPPQDGIGSSTNVWPVVRRAAGGRDAVPDR
jgi:hypothetical protein